MWYCQLRFASILTPKYLTLSVGYSLLPHNLIFKSPSNFFCLDLKITISVFFTLSEILFAFNQLTRCFKSALTSLFSFLIELLRHKRLVSSAKWWTLRNFIAWLRSFIYSKNRRGPRTDPWGKPRFKAARPDSHPFITITITITIKQIGDYAFNTNKLVNFSFERFSSWLLVRTIIIYEYRWYKIKIRSN